MSKKEYSQVTEFIGLPASGKSTFATGMSLNTGRTLIEINGRFERFIRAILFATTKPIVFFHLLKLTIKQYSQTRHPLIKHKVLYLLFSAVAKEQKAENIPNAIIDEGIFQYLLSMYEQEISIEVLKKELSFLEKYSREIVFLTASEKVRKDRMRSRQRRFRSGAVERSYYTKLEKVIEHNIHVIAETLSLFHFKVIRVDTSKQSIV